jgi:CHAT domain-containing protein/TPR repeat protein
MLKRFLVILIICLSSQYGSAVEVESGFLQYQTENYIEALPKLLILAESGDVKAAALVARMYVLGLGTRVNYPEGYLWAFKAANEGDPLAQNLLGILYKNGWGTTKNLEDSIIWFKKSANQNFVLAFLNLGDAYAYGLGTKVDRDEALKWYDRAAIEGNVSGMFKASIFGWDSDKEKSFKYLRASADQDFGDAMASLGDKYYYGDFVVKDFYEARKWYELAWKTKSKFAPHAAYMLGFMSFRGIGEPKNTSKAIELYQKAADAGSAQSLNELGRIYQNGIETDENQQLAFNYYLRSADLGNRIGQEEAGLHLMDGRGVPNNIDLAKKYFQMGARQGSLLARIALLDLEIADRSKGRHLSKALLGIKSLALEYQSKSPKTKNYTDDEDASLIKRARGVLDTFPREGDKLSWNLELKANAKILVNDINSVIKRKAYSENTQEAIDYLKIIKYSLEAHFNGAIFQISDIIFEGPETLRRSHLNEEIRLFSDYLIKKYPPNHVFYIDALRLQFYSKSNMSYVGKKADIDQIVNFFIEPSTIAGRLAATSISDESTCSLFLAHLQEWSYMNMVKLMPEVRNETDLTREIEFVVQMAEDSEYCLDERTFESLKSSWFSLVQNANVSLKAYFLRFIPSGKYFSSEIAIAMSLGNSKRAEYLLKEKYAQESKVAPVFELLPYYLRDHDFDKANAAIRRRIKESLGSEFGLSNSDLISKITKLPGVSDKQKIYLLKKSVEIDKRQFYEVTERWKADEILGGYDWSNKDVQRQLIEELFDKKRNIEAELIIQFLKVDEVSELLRDDEIKKKFQLPDWFYTSEEKKIDKKFLRYLEEAEKNYRASGVPNYSSGDNISDISESSGNKFVDFLIFGNVQEKLPNVKKHTQRLPDRLGSLIKLFPQSTAIVQYIINRDNLLININVKNRKVMKKVFIGDQALETKIFLFRGAINNKQNVVGISSELYKILFKPIEDDLTRFGINHIVLSLDGKLRYVPFSALWDEKQFLVKKYSFTFFDEINQVAIDKLDPNNIRVAGFGVSKNTAGFSALPNVQTELQQIVLNKSGGIYPGKIVLDREFTFEEFKSTLAQQYPVIHIATHFRFSPGTENNSFLLLGDGNHLNLELLKTLDFRGVELVTYSGCQTGMGGGKDEDGKEIAGLSYVSQRKGAKAVIASLWSVSDKSTSELMTRMYKVLSKSRVSVSKALQEAKLDLIKSPEYGHPFHWAGFQLYGSAR